ncbi:hypothetical protein ACN20G_26090 [Streptomyces sp. BI20]|uniref:hypothetical protein n=1 Tax=Streptomyces sp. BI20 TaxID=3403460 RepID=UPI003C73CE81
MTRPDPTPRDLRPARWPATRIAAGPWTALLTGALALVAVFVAVALPRVLDRDADRALRHDVAAAGPEQRGLFGVSQTRPGAPGGGRELDEILDRLRADVRASGLSLRESEIVHGTRGTRTGLTGPGLPRPDGLDPLLDLLHLRGVEKRVEWISGRPPGAPSGGAIEIALSEGVAKTLGIRVGQVHTVPSTAKGPGAVRVTGVYRVPDPQAERWEGLPCLLASCQDWVQGDGKPQMRWLSAGLVGEASLPTLSAWTPRLTDFWRLPLVSGTLTAATVPETKGKVTEFLTGPRGADLPALTNRPDFRIVSDLPRHLDDAVARQAALAPLTLIGPLGLAGVIGVVLCLAAALGTDRRREELRLLIARGASRPGVLRALLAEQALLVLPAAVLAGTAAVLAFPTPRLLPGLLWGAATALVALLAGPVRAAALLAPAKAAAPVRRLVGELTVLIVTIAAVVAVRRRGVAPSGTDTTPVPTTIDVDPLLVAAPLLVALTVGLLLARVQPLVLGLAARLAARRRGLIGFVGLVRAARPAGAGRARPSVLPALALLLAVTTAGFGGTVLDSLAGARLIAARHQVGADATVHGTWRATLTPELVRALDATPGLRDSLTAWVDTEGSTVGTENGSVPTTVIAVDPEKYAALARHVGRGTFDPEALARPAAAGTAADPLPALVGTGLRRQGLGEVHEIRLRTGHTLRVRPVATVADTPALRPDPGALILVLPAGPTTRALLPESTTPTHWFGTGDAVTSDALNAALRAGAGERAKDYVGTTALATVPTLGDTPLEHDAGRLFTACAALAAAFALLALLITLVRAAPERAALLARLRTMGLRPREAATLILVEALPAAWVAALVGGATAVLAAALLGPAVDLAALVGTTAVPARVLPAAGPVWPAAAALAGLAALAVLAEALLVGRRQITTELRAGDNR